MSKEEMSKENIGRPMRFASESSASASICVSLTKCRQHVGVHARYIVRGYAVSSDTTITNIIIVVIVII